MRIYLKYEIYTHNKTKMEQERIYEFHGGFNGNTPILVEVKESELSEKQRDVMLGEVVFKFNNLPSLLQNQFLENLGLVDKVEVKKSPIILL